MRLEFASAGRIIFGEGTVIEAASTARQYGERVLLVCGAGKTVPDRMIDLLAGNGLFVSPFLVDHEPSLDMVRSALTQIRAEQLELVVAYGGGSSIDTAKAAAILARNSGDPLDYLEVVGKGLPLKNSGLPVIAVPTTAGTGSEVTRNAVIYVKEQKVKVSLRSAMMIPKLAVVDPELTYSVPPEITASTGMDALTQVLEPFVSVRANPLIDSFCRDGLQRSGRSLLAAYQNGSNSPARMDLSLTSLMGGLALANAGLGAVHGFAAPIGGMFDVAHGVVCARLLAPVIQINVLAMRKRNPEHPALEKYQEAARLITGSPHANAQVLVNWLEALCEEMQIPRLGEIGIHASDIEEISTKAAKASSMQANPIQLDLAELREILNLGL
jgi:alcohol dehydrogenase class IV